MLSNGNNLRRVVGSVLVAGALGFGVSACGGDKEEPPAQVATTGPTEVAELTKAALIDQGDAICAEVNAAIGAIDSSTADDATKSSQREGIYDGLVARLSNFGAPSDGEAPTEVIAAIQGLADGTGDAETLQSAAEAYGFEDCAEAPAATASPVEPAGTGGESSGAEETYTPPVTETPQSTTPPPTTTTPPSSGGGVAPPPSGGGTGSGSGGSSGGSTSGGIGPG